MKNNEQCLTVGPIDEVIKFLNISAREFGSAINKNTLIRRQYELHYLFEE